MLTETQIAERVHSIGSSDAAAICGLNPWRSPLEVFLEKTGRAAHFAGNEATEAGDDLEDAIVNRTLRKLQAVSHERAPALLTADGYPFITANLDATAILPEGDKTIIEAKSSGITKMLDFSAWGEEWSADVPDYYQCQVQHQLFVAGDEYAFAILSALLPPRGFVIFCIPRQEDVIEALIERHTAFWQLVMNDTPPEGEVSLDVAKRLRRTTGKSVDLDPELVASFLRAQDDKKAASEAEDAARAKLLLALGDAEVGRYDGGEFTYLESTAKGYTVEERKYRTLRNRATRGK